MRIRVGRAAVVAGLAGAAALGGVAYRRGRRTLTTLPITIGSRRQRSSELARFGTKTGSAYALHRARRAFAAADRREELDAEFQLRTAEQATELLGNMKGALMKVGQMASYIDQGLPEPVRAALAELQADAPPMAPELSAEVVETSFGRSLDDLFLEWDPTPIASASIGQVHRAITRDNTAVAVKVQYPGIAEAIEADLDNADLMFAAIGMMYPGLDPEPVVTEIRDRIVEELDYRQEVKNQQLFADWYRDHPFIHIPDVVEDLSTDLVLTTELAEGARFDELLTWPREEQQLAAETIYRFVFRSLYHVHAFNGDPHPGNYLFRPGGRVTFLDFGLVKHFTPQEVTNFEELIKAMVFERDIPRYRQLLIRTGLLNDHERFSDELVAEYFGHFYEMVLENRTYAITPEWSSDSVRRFFDPLGPYGEIAKAANLPPAWVIIQRINLGLFAILGDLRAAANFRRIAEELWPWVSGPPSTELGRLEAEWIAGRRGPNTL